MRRATAIGNYKNVDDQPATTTTSEPKPSSASSSSIVAINDDDTDPNNVGGPNASVASSFEHVASDETPFVREFKSPTLVTATLTANAVPKPPRHSLERGVQLTDVGPDGGAEPPLPPTSPVPKTEKSIDFAKTNVD